MFNKPKIQFLIFFIAGFVTAGLLAWSLSHIQKAYADQYSCIRSDLDAEGMTGNIPDPEFSITYKVPSCYAANGYKVQNVYMYGNDVAVRYVKK